MKKKWPKNDQVVSFIDLTGPVVKAIRFAYKLERQNKGKGIKIEGLDTPDLATGPRDSVLLNAKNLKYSEEEHGRDALTEIIGYAVRLGIEQGRRMTMTGSVVQSLISELKWRKLELKDLKQSTKKQSRQF